MIERDQLIEALAGEYWYGMDTDANAVLVNVAAVLLDLDANDAQALIEEHVRATNGAGLPCPVEGCTLALVQVTGLHMSAVCPAHGSPRRTQ